MDEVTFHALVAAAVVKLLLLMVVVSRRLRRRRWWYYYCVIEMVCAWSLFSGWLSACGCPGGEVGFGPFSRVVRGTFPRMGRNGKTIMAEVVVKQYMNVNQYHQYHQHHQKQQQGQHQQQQLALALAPEAVAKFTQEVRKLYSTLLEINW
jgi:hypothetical protein